MLDTTAREEKQQMLGIILRKLWDKALDLVLGHIWVVMLPSVLAILVYLIFLFSQWVFATHTVTLPGWAWVGVGSLCLAGIVAAIFIFIGRHSPMPTWEYKHKSDVLHILRRHFQYSRITGDCLVRFPDLDSRCDLRPGSAKRYAAKAAKAEGYEILSMGRETMQVRRKYYG